MRPTIWRLAALGALLVPGTGTASNRDGRDDDWCREQGGDSRRARHCEVREVTLPAPDRIDVDARPNGGARVRGRDASGIHLRVKVEATAGTEAEAKALAAQVRVETQGTIRAVGPETRGGERSWQASFDLEVPRRTSLHVVALNGGLAVEDVAGTAELETRNGGLSLARVGGRVQGRTTNGGLHVALSNSEWNGEGLDLRTTNGGIVLELPAEYNAHLELGTVNGRILGDLPAAGRADRPVGGTIATDLGRGGRPLSLHTVNGGIVVGRH